MKNLLTSKYAFTRDTLRILYMVIGNLFQRFQHQSANPNTNVGSDNVHEAESSDNFEPMDV